MSFFFYIIFFAAVHSTRISETENLRVKEICGKTSLDEDDDVSFKSFGGRKVLEGEYPWLMTLSYKEFLVTRCSGALISQRHILTAAHCIINSANYVEENDEQCKIDKRRRIFKRDYRNDTELWDVYVGARCSTAERCSKRRIVAELMPHPFFDECEYSDDIAIFELKEDIPETEAVPICMPLKRTKLRKILKAAGSGSDTTLPWYAEFSNGMQVITLTLKNERASSNEIETISKNSSLCSGDSGGPLFQYNRAGKIAIVGVASTIIPHCRVENDTRSNYFEDVRRHISWICHNTGVCPVNNDRPASN